MVLPLRPVGFLLLAWIWIVGPPRFVAADDAPAINRLFPAGGQLGATTEITLGGGKGTGTPQFWSWPGQLQGTLAEDGKKASITVPADARPGIHWIRFFNDVGISAPRAFIVGHTAEVAEEEPNNLPTEADLLESETVTVNGVLAKTGDTDVYAIEVPEGRTLVASMQAHRDLASPMDAVLQILDTAGTVVAQNDDDHGLDPQIALDVPAAGTYYVRTFAFPSAPNSTIRLAGAASYIYRLTITHGPFIDHVFPAVVDRRSDSAVAVCGWNLSSQQEIVGITPFDTAHAHFGRDFALPHVVQGVEHASTLESDVARTLAVGTAVSGRITASEEQDTYIVPGIKGQKLIFQVRARAWYSMLDPVLIIKAADGKVLSETDDTKGADFDAESTVTVPADGPLTVSVQDRFGSGGFRYFYCLSCRRPAPGFQATVASNQYVLNSDDSVDVIVNINRQHGFAEALTVSLERLPPGVKSRSVVSEKEGDSSKTVTLKLTRRPNASAFSGPIQVMCRTTDGRRRQFAQTALGNPKTLIPDIWVTVIPKPEEPATEKPAE